ncbi:PAS domain-containing sensor histidine kinase [Belliella sp. DSM 107340]|uniref:histidine kinase n=1 Tax=Belliella calami TaxID=2923436 RepID=A0ABS9URM0_9BACT|nr:PAS domain-containing sensor histidine kinase [Belliella calami]MCH7399282.1 PAS domain-containing sensor histidine kinase [Belliella calami]
MIRKDLNSEILEKLDYFFEISPDLFCIAGYDGFFKKINPAVSNLLGYDEETLFSTPINDFVHPEDQEVTAKARKELTKSKPLLNFENRYLTKNGEIVWLSWTSMFLEKDRLVFAIAKDITYKKKLEAERNQLLSNLMMINKEMETLTYRTTHDLRSPVNNFIAILNLIDQSKIDDRENIELLGLLKESTENLKNKLDSYVDLLSKRSLEESKFETVRFEEALNEVKNSIHSLISSSNTTIETDFSRVETVIFNREYMESVFLNLITNSIRYAQPGQPPFIKVKTKKTGKTPIMTIEDNGMGFDMEKVKGKIFGLNQKFHSHEDSKGIGLYLIYNQIKKLYGNIEVESEVNTGTKFTITFQSL